MDNERLETLCDLVNESHALIQRDFKDINPIVGVFNRMRESGVPMDMMTIDCPHSGKRIILLLNDHLPHIISYQFAFKDKEIDDEFEQIDFDELTVERLYDWIKGYFLKTAN